MTRTPSVYGQKSPAVSRKRRRGRVELIPKRCKGTEYLIDFLRQRPGGRIFSRRAYNLLKKLVIGMTATLQAHMFANVVRQAR
jgi:hypothetical protein